MFCIRWNVSTCALCEQFKQLMRYTVILQCVSSAPSCFLWFWVNKSDKNEVMHIFTLYSQFLKRLKYLTLHQADDMMWDIHLKFKTQVYVLKRPFVDDFLAFLANKFECVLFTASLAKYADPVSDLLDVHGCFSSRLFREACIFHKGNYVKVWHFLCVLEIFIEIYWQQTCHVETYTIDPTLMMQPAE